MCGFLGDPPTFKLVRLVDESGISGTGDVAQGVVFRDGTVAMRWMTDKRSTSVYTSMQDLLAIHGHGGKTEVRYHMGPGRDDRACSACGHPWLFHVHDNCGGCEYCNCTLLVRPEPTALGKESPRR